MRVRRSGLIRLWIVLSVVWTVSASLYAFTDLAKGWGKLDSMSYQMCYDSEVRKPQDTIDQCLEREGVHRGVFEREHTTAWAWWSGAFGLTFLIDLVVTAILIALFYVIRWVWQGFRSARGAEQE